MASVQDGKASDSQTPPEHGRLKVLEEYDVDSYIHDDRHYIPITQISAVVLNPFRDGAA